MASAARFVPQVAIVSDPGIMGGCPCVEATRVPAEAILACLNGGDSAAAIYAAYPTCPPGTLEAVAAWAQDNGLACCAS